MKPARSKLGKNRTFGPLEPFNEEFHEGEQIREQNTGEVPASSVDGQTLDIAMGKAFDQIKSFNHGHENEQSGKSVGPNNNTINDGDRLQVNPINTYNVQRRESFLYRSDSDNESNQPPRSSRHSSISSEGVHGDELVTPFAQVLSSLQSVRSNFVLLTNIRQNRLRRGSEGFHLNSRLCQLYEISDGSMIRDDMFKKLTMATLKEFDWCLDQLDTLKASMSISEMASNKFKRLLDRELKDFSETGIGGPEISAWVFDTFVDKQMELLPRREAKPLRARSKSLVKSLKKLSRSVSCSGSVPRFGVECSDEASLEEIMEYVDTWSFDVFKLAKATSYRPLTAITYTILQTRDLLKFFKIKPWVFTNYISLVESHYVREVPFHNSTHAADVVHATHVLLSASVFEGVFTDLEILAAIIASAVHDVDHPGVNNQFLVNSSSEMALMYNDESVLENHHLAVAFQLLQSENCDILDNFSRAERQLFRKMVIEMVLATDNAKHMNILGSLKTMVETKKVADGGVKPVEAESFPEKMHVLKCLVHCADLSNPTRPLHLYETWVERLMEEFFRQGDIERERGMEISPMMDRHNANIEKSQVVFIDYVVHPLWETWGDLVYPDAQEILGNLVTNREYFRSQCPASPSATPGVTPKASPFTPRKSMPAAVDISTSRRLFSSLQEKSDDTNKTGNFLVKNDIKLFQRTNDSGRTTSATENFEVVDPVVKDLRRKSDSDALRRHSSSDIRLASLKLLKLTNIQSDENMESDDKETEKNDINNLKTIPDQNKNYLKESNENRTTTAGHLKNTTTAGHLPNTSRSFAQT